MKKIKFFQVFFPILLLAIPWVYLANIWHDLPQIVPTHFGINGMADKFGNKTETIFILLILQGVGLITYFILKNIQKIDPKKKYTADNVAVIKKISVVLLLLISFLSVIILYSTLHAKIAGMPVLFFGLSLFLAYMGNLMYSIKQNYFAGIRVPWTLDNEDNWRKTHHLASKIWFAGGIILALVSLLINIKLLVITFIIAVLLMSIIPIIYSYTLFKKNLTQK